jgi:hypothetical protein
MRRLATALLLTTTLVPAGARAAEFAWPGRGTVRMTVPASWTVSSGDAGELGVGFRAAPKAGAVVAQITLAALPPGKAVRADDVKKELEKLVQPYLDGTVERTFAPKPLTLSQGSGWVVQLTDASLVGKPPEPGNYKVMRNALAALGDGVLMIATIQFDDPSLPQVAEAMALLSSLRLEPNPGAKVAASTTGSFEFSVPQSRVTVRVPDLGLRPDGPIDLERRYFMLSRSNPQLIVSGWLEPASAYQGLKAFWESESRSPAYSGAGAPTRVELLRVGPWEVVAYDIPLPGGSGTSAHLRAERVQAGSWIDLHLSSTSSRAATALREDLVTALRAIEVVEK